MKEETRQWLHTLTPPPTEVLEARIRRTLRGQLLLVALLSLLVGVLIGHYSRPLADRQDLARPTPLLADLCASRTESTPSPTITPHPLRVHVSGAVRKSGVITLPPDSLVADALTAAGGPSEGADLDAVNLAAPVADHQHIVIPSRTAPTHPTASPSPSITSTIDINTASASELERLPHIGPTMARRIIEYRETNGPFRTKEELMNVPGIGPKRYADIEPLITVGP